MKSEPRKVDLVLEGGGVRGIGLVGALAKLEEQGYQFVNIAGSSAGAIVATLLAAGYTAQELRTILMDLHFQTFLDPSFLMRIPLVGTVVAELIDLGFYKGDVLYKILYDLLAKKGVRTFADLDASRFPEILEGVADEDRERYRFKVRITASDITRKRLVILPQDIAIYGIRPENLEVAQAVRMSMSIPFFFKPVRIKEYTLVDGGLLSNFPIELFDTPGIPLWPTFGIKLVESQDLQPQKVLPRPITGPVSALIAISHTLIEAHDAYYLENDKFARTIMVDASAASATDFAITTLQKEALYQAGRTAAEKFLSRWNFDAYKALYRSRQSPPSRRSQVFCDDPVKSD